MPVDVSAEALARFDATSLDHPHRDTALDELEAFHKSGARIGFLTGPELSGKSDLACAFARRINGKAGPDALPVLVARATGLCGTAFHPDLFIREFAAAARVPALDDLCAPPQQLRDLFGQVCIVPRLPKGSQRDRTEVMSGALRHAARHRRVDLLVVDAIERIFPWDRPRHLMRYRCLEDIAERTGVRMLLVGRDGLAAAVLASVKALGSPPVVRLRRYAEVRKGTGYEAFHSFAQRLLDDVPGVEMERIDHEAMAQLHARCLGCPGLLAGLVRAALSDAAHEGLFRSSTVRVDDVVRKGRSATQMRARLAAIRQDEAAIAAHVHERPEDELMLAEELGLIPAGSACRKPRRQPKAAPVGNPIHRRRVGERNPGRIREESP